MRNGEQSGKHAVRIVVTISLKVMRRLRGVHRDERGVISVLSVFAIFLFTILLMLLVNTGRQIDDKIRMQNAADAGAYSGGVCVARGMNAIAFSNHLLCEVFALTAYMREARDRHADIFVPHILSSWKRVGEVFHDHGGHQKFVGLGSAILQKIPVEQEMVDSFSEMAAQQSKIVLPHLEYILCGPDFDDPPSVAGQVSPEGGFIPHFQRAVILTTPQLAQVATQEIARRYGTTTERLHENRELLGVFWKTSVEQAGTTDESDYHTRTIPAVDPSPTGTDGRALPSMKSKNCYYCLSRSERRRLSHQYLNDWITLWQSPYFEFPHNADPRMGSETAKMSNYINLYRIFACGQLDNLLNNEYPDVNLPFMLRETRRGNCEGLLGPECWQEPNPPCAESNSSDETILETDYMFVAGAYWPPLKPLFPGLYENPLKRDSRTYAVTFAQVHFFIPRARFACCPWSTRHTCYTAERIPYPCWVDHYDNWPRRWDLFNQNWTAKLVPATATYLGPILATHPGHASLSTYNAPNLSSITDQELRAVNYH